MPKKSVKKRAVKKPKKKSSKKPAKKLVKKAPKKSVKKKVAKPKSKPKLHKRYKEDLRVFLFLSAAVVLLVLLARNNSTNNSTNTKIEGAVILDVTSEQIGESDTYVFYYDVSNPTDKELVCDVIVEINNVPYVQRIVLEPNQEVTTQTEVEMPGGENTIKIYADC